MGNIEKAVNLTDYFVSLPHSRYFIIGILILGLLLGVAINLNKFQGTELILKGFLAGFIIICIPAFMSAVAVKLMIIRVPFRRIIATTFVAEFIYALTYLASYFLSSIDPSKAQFILFIGAAVVFILWYLIARLVFILKWRSFIFAIIQLLFHLIFLLSSTLIDFQSGQINTIIKFYIASFVSLISLYLFFTIINAPMKRNFGFSSTEVFTMFISQWLYQKKDLEEAFETVGEKVIVPLSVYSFKRKDEIVSFVVPYIHFGPFGNLGGSEFSYKIADAISSQYNQKSFVFHGTATHDLNPISSDELSKIIDCYGDCMNSAQFKSSSVSLLNGSSNECRAENLIFDDASFISLTRAPLVTEDINFGVGLALMSDAEKKIPLATVVDQHNSETGQVTSFEPGSDVAFNYMRSIQDSFTKKNKSEPLQVGFSFRSIETDHIGKAGIKIAIFSTKPKYCLVLIDCNGVTPEFREKLLLEIKEVGKQYGEELHPAVFTTDTHQINNIKGVLNPLKDEAESLGEIKAGVAEAILDINETKFFATKKWFELNTFGAKQSIELISTVNSVVAVAKIALPIVIIISIAVIFGILSVFK